MKRFATALLVAGLASAGSAHAAAVGVVAFDNFGGDDLNLTSFTGEESYSSAGDGFQEYNSGDSAPFTLIDSSTGTFLTDTSGIVVEDVNGDYDPFFGAIDTVNSSNLDGLASAVWTFDVTGSTDLEVSFDIAAFGDFESSDDYDITIAVDGNDLVTFSLVADEAGDLDYTLADGDTFNLNDPMTLNGAAIDNVYSTFTASSLGAGDTVTVTVDAVLDGGSEGIALDSITVVNVPEPGSLALLGLGGLLIARRRRG